jgi:drug/metabolite transporter (DMT)-like permease
MSGVPASSVLVLALGVVACSTSVLFIKASRIEPALLAAARLLIAAAVLAPLYVRARRETRTDPAAVSARRAIVPGIVLALHFITWIIGARATPAVNSSLLVNLVPVVTPLLLYALVRETIQLREAVGTIVALLGGLLLTGADYRLAPEHLAGDLVCFASMLLFALYLVLARRNRSPGSLWLYTVPLYLIGGCVCLLWLALAPASLGETRPLLGADAAPPDLGRELLLVAGLALIPTVVGHSILNHAMQRMRGQVVGLANLSQPLFAGGLAVWLLGEIPHAVVYPAAALVVVGCAMAFTGSAETEEPRTLRDAVGDRQASRA